jgi:hypothetical protein
MNKADKAEFTIPVSRSPPARLQASDSTLKPCFQQQVLKNKLRQHFFSILGTICELIEMSSSSGPDLHALAIDHAKTHP